MKNFIKALFRKREGSPIGKLFKQECVFAHSEQVGDLRIFEMQSGAVYLAELVDVSGRLEHSADDTAQRDLTWKVLDVVTVQEDHVTKTKTVTSPRYGSIEIAEEMIAFDAWRKPMQIVNDIFMRKFFPEMYSSPRFLRG